MAGRLGKVTKVLPQPQIRHALLKASPHGVTEPLLHREDLLLVDGLGGLEKLADGLAAGLPFQSKLASACCTGFGQSQLQGETSAV